MFTLSEIDEDPSVILDLKEDIREECETLGKVTNIVVFDKEEEGVVSLRYVTEEGAQACIKAMNGRFFSGQKIEAEIYDGNTRFRKSGKTDEEEGDEATRLEKFAQWLESEE